MDTTRAMGQWKKLKETIRDSGAEIVVMEAKGAHHLPDLVFIANAAVIRGSNAYLATFRHTERRGEQKYYDIWLRSVGFRTFHSENIFHEGTGDALFGGRQGNVLFSAVGPRSQYEAIKEIQKRLSTDRDPFQILAVNLIDSRFYHLDTCFCPLENGLGLWYRKAFDHKSQEKILNHMEMLDVNERDAANFACNAVVVNRNVIMHEGSEVTARLLEKNGYRVQFVNMEEFIKAGGSAKCCTLRLT